MQSGRQGVSRTDGCIESKEKKRADMPVLNILNEELYDQFAAEGKLAFLHAARIRVWFYFKAFVGVQDF